MPTPITICEVPDEVREELAARAALSGRSLEEYVRAELIALAQRPSAAVWMARVRARKDALQHPLPDPRRAAGSSAAGSSAAGDCAAEDSAAEAYAAARYAAEEEDAAEHRSGDDHARAARELESGVDHGISTCRDVG